jgi:hypothetical protein
LEGLELKILFKNSKAYLTEDRLVHIENSGLPDRISNFQSHAYWIIRVKKTFEHENRISCEVISYHQGKSEFDHHQKQLAENLNRIQSISFDNIDTFGLIRTFSKKGKGFTSRPIKPKPAQGQNFPFKEETIREPLKYQINRSFDFPIKNLDFKDGFVSFEQKFNEYPKSIYFTIENEDIEEKYDPVKNYFGNFLKTKKVKITVRVYIEHDEVVSVSADSPEIKRINKQLIEEVKLNFVKSTVKKRTKTENECDLLTAEEYFETFFDDDFKLKAFYANDEELVRDMVKISNSKHYKNLRYLSSKHSHELMRLRILHRPLSFIFLVEGDNQYHFLWETLNTEEATYIWHIDKDINVLKDYLNKINEIIRMIKVEGKLEYISKTEDKFSRIFHDYNDSIDGFLKWKEDLERKLL